MRTALNKSIAGTVALIIALVMAEVLVRLFYSPGDFLIVKLVPDPVLGHRIPPDSGGHDASGYRNRAVPDRVAIIAVGDSQTYGTSAGDLESWPSQLAEMSGQAVYNMGVGGYGPLDYGQVANEGVARLAPEVVVVGLYFGNDLMDCYHDVYSTDVYPDLRQPERATTARRDADTKPTNEHWSRGLRTWLAQHSMLYGLIKNRLSNAVFFLRAQAEAEEVGADQLMVWQDPERPAIRTAFTPRRRLDALGLDDERISEGRRIAAEAMRRLKHELDEKGVAMLVVLIPTKESVYESLVESQGSTVPDALRALWAAERYWRRAMTDSLSEQGIPWVDALPALQSALREGRQLYLQNGDGHPIGAGYGEIAKLVAAHETVRRVNPLRDDVRGRDDS